MSLRTPIVAIVGRPNVGKSTLFNRIVGRNSAVVEDVEGVTRDRNYELCERFLIPFVVVDTGGFDPESQDALAKQVADQVLIAIDDADVIVAMFDGNAGLQPRDRDIVELLRQKGSQAGKDVYFVVNKCDGKEQHLKIAEFYELGVDELIDISALHGHGVTNLIEGVLENLDSFESLQRSWEAKKEKQRRLEEQAKMDAAAYAAKIEALDDDLQNDEPELVEEEFEANFASVWLPGEEQTDGEYAQENKLRDMPKRASSGQEEEDLEDEAPSLEAFLPENINVAIIGRPNVGKSTLLNTLLGEQRAIVSDISGTTRDSLDVAITRDGQDYTIVDTAGLRKRGNMESQVERYSAMRTLKALAACDVAVVVIDASDGPTLQDAKIVGMAHDQGKGIIIAVNKWDLVEKDHKTVRQFTQQVREEFKFAPYAPVVFVSALSGRRCPRIIDAVKQVAGARLKRVSTGILNRRLQRALKHNSLPVYRGRPIKLYFGAQVAVGPPRFSLFFNYPKGVHFSYLRFLKNELRDAFGFEGTDIKLMAKKHGEKNIQA